MRRAQAIVVAAVTLLAPCVAQAETLAEIFEGANAAYYRGDYDAAARGYRRLDAAGVLDADVSYNLGITEAKRGRYGPAIQLLERALWLSPGDAEAARALDEVRAQVGRRRAAARGEAEVDSGPPMSEALVGGLSTDLLVALALLFDLVLFGALAGLLFARRESLRLGLGIAAVAAGAGLVASGSGVLLKSGWLEDGSPAVVLEDGTALREGPDHRATERHHVEEGRRAWVLDEDRGWLRVRVPTVGEGWAPADSIGLVRVE